MPYSKHTQDELCQGCIDRLKEGHQQLMDMYLVIRSEYKDAHVSWVKRGEKDQNEAFQKGASKLKFPQSKHNKTPAEAFDLFQIDQNGKAIFDKAFCMKANALLLKHGFKFRTGAVFKSIGDYGHFEIVI